VRGVCYFGFTLGEGESVDSVRIWQEVYKQLRQELGNATPAYLEGVRLTHEPGNRFRISAPTVVVMSELELKYQEPIHRALSSVVPGGVSMVFDVAGDVRGPGRDAGIGEGPGPILKLPPNPPKKT
jgi:hypothetical protein